MQLRASDIAPQGSQEVAGVHSLQGRQDNQHIPRQVQVLGKRAYRAGAAADK